MLEKILSLMINIEFLLAVMVLILIATVLALAWDLRRLSKSKTQTKRETQKR
jgi:flagellar biogenesis protein FliO